MSPRCHLWLNASSSTFPSQPRTVRSCISLNRAEREKCEGQCRICQKHVSNMREMRGGRKVSHHQRMQWFKLLFSSSLECTLHLRAKAQQFCSFRLYYGRANSSELITPNTWHWLNLLIFHSFKTQNCDNIKGTNRMYTIHYLRSPVLHQICTIANKFSQLTTKGSIDCLKLCLHSRKTTVLSTWMKSKGTPCCGRV